MKRPRPQAVGSGAEAWILGFAGFLLVFASAALIVGLHDVALRDSSLGVTITSVVLLGTGAVSLVAAYQLVGLSRKAGWEDAQRPTCRPPVLIALTLVVLIALYAFVSGIRAGGEQRAVVAVVSMLLIAVAGAGLLAFGRDARVTIPRVGAVAIALIGATVSAWQVWYQNEYGPSQAGRAVALRSQLTREGPQRTNEVVRATIRLEAVSGTNLSVVGSVYTLTGARVVRCDRSERVDAHEVSEVLDGFLPDPQRSRFAADAREQQPGTLLYAGKFVADGRRLEPHVPHVREIVFYVPRSRYQLLRLRTSLFAISGGVNLSQATLPTFELGGDNYVYGFWPVDDRSWLRDLVYGRERWLVIRYEIVREPGAAKAGTDHRVTARLTDPSWEGRRPTIEEATTLFAEPRPIDPAEPFATTELALGDVAEPTPEDSLPKGCRR